MVLFFAVRWAVHALHHLLLNAKSSTVAEAPNWRQADRKGGLAQSAAPAAVAKRLWQSEGPLWWCREGGRGCSALLTGGKPIASKGWRSWQHRLWWHSVQRQCVRWLRPS